MMARSRKMLSRVQIRHFASHILLVSEILMFTFRKRLDQPKCDVRSDDPPPLSHQVRGCSIFTINYFELPSNSGKSSNTSNLSKHRNAPNHLRSWREHSR